MAKDKTKNIDELKSMINPVEHKVIDAIADKAPKLIPALLESAKKIKKESAIISPSAASKIAGVSRQALHGMFKKGNSSFGFFTPDGKVDSSHPHWADYLEERKNKSGPGIKPAVNNSQKSGKIKSEDKSGKKSPAESGSGWDRDHALTGGFDPAMFTPSNPAQLKALTDIVARNLEIRMKLGDLIPREIVDSYINRISHGVNQFVALGRSVSTDICEKLDRVGMEREVEKMINPKIKSIIEQIIESCNNAKK
jgi:hypothetical protein